MWIFGKLTYYLNKSTKDLVTPNTKNSLKLEHCFIGKKLGNGVIISTITSDKVSHIKKISIKNICFFDYISNSKHETIKYISRPIYFTDEQFKKFFEYENSLVEMAKMLKLPDDYYKDFIKNLVLNFRSLFNLLENETVIEVIETCDKGEFMELKVKTKTVNLIIDEFSVIYVEKYLDISQENISNLALLFEDPNEGIRELCEATKNISDGTI